jgi:hypothetical protein
LQSNDAQLNPTSFVQSHVPNGFGPELRALAQAAGGPVAQFTKDTNRVDSRIRKLRMDLSNGIFVIAPPDLVGPNRPVSVRSNSSGSDVVTITGGTITSVKSSGGN